MKQDIAFFAAALAIALAAVPGSASADPGLAVPGTVWDLPVMATWTDDPSSTATLAFERPVPCTALLRYEQVDRSAVLAVPQDVPSYRHIYDIRGLRPGTTYSYSVSASDGYAQTGTFRTAPRPGDTNAAFSFILHNDLQGGIDVQAAAAVADAIAAHEPDRLFVLSTGDLGDNRFSSDYPDCVLSWQRFFAATSNELASSIFLPVAGNHDEPENPGSFWYRVLEHPGDGRDFSFDIGPVRFIALAASEDEIPARTGWLARELQAAASDSTVRWIIPVFHRPPYSWGEREGQAQVRDLWAPLFTRYEASLVLSGHAHAYQRLHPVDGVPYLVSAGGGGRLYPVDPGRPEIAFATSCYHYVRFDLAPDGSLTLAAKTPAGDVFDAHTYPAPRRHVQALPAFPRRGGLCTILYDPAGSPLADADEIYLQAGSDDWRDVFLREPMQRLDDGRFSLTFTVPVAPKTHISYCFRNGDASLWDNNHRQDWQTILAPPFTRE